jgi:hypothetical protein
MERIKRMTESVEFVPLKAAPMPLEVDSDTATYIGVLEGTVAALCVNECKYRAFLELLTGEPWEDTRIDFKGEVLQQLAVSSLVRQTGMDRAKAVALVATRWQKRNLPIEQTVPVAVPVEDFVSGDSSNRSQENNSRPDMSERYRAWRERQIADAEKL